MAASTLVIGPALPATELEAPEPGPLTVYCLPVSGGGFVAQLGLLSEIYQARWIGNGRRQLGTSVYQPNLILAASGGNVATYVAMAGNWSPDGIERVVAKLESKMFIRSWWPDHLSFLPTFMLGAFNGSMYRQGYGVSTLFRSLFTCQSIQRTEIWTGTYDQSNRRAQFFCNLAPGASLIKSDYFDDSSHFHGCMPLKYLNGDLDKIAAASTASASIPILVSQQQMDGCDYADGGAMFASPMSAMHSEIYRLVMGSNPYKEKLERQIQAATASGTAYQLHLDASSGDIPLTEVTSSKGVSVTALGSRPLRMVYFCSYEMDVPRGEAPPEGEAGKISGALAQLLHANLLQDRSACTGLIQRICGDESVNIQYRHHPKLTTDKLAEVLAHLDRQRHYILVLYPHGSPSISIAGFTTADITKQMAACREAYGAHVWYYPYPRGDPRSCQQQLM